MTQEEKARVVTWVSPIGDANQRGTRYMTAVFSNGESAYIGKNDLDTAMEVHGLLQECIDKDRFFLLEDTGRLNKKDQKQYKIISFEGYQGFQGGGTGSSASETPQEASIRAAVALKAAATACTTGILEDVLGLAEELDHWLAKKSGADGASSSAPTVPDPSGEVADGEAVASPGTTYQDRWAAKFGNVE